MYGGLSKLPNDQHVTRHKQFLEGTNPLEGAWRQELIGQWPESEGIIVLARAIEAAFWQCFRFIS